MQNEIAKEMAVSHCVADVRDVKGKEESKCIRNKGVTDVSTSINCK